MIDKSKLKLYLLVLAMFLFIVSCNQESGPVIDTTEVQPEETVAENPDDNEIALLTDADFENAVLEEATFDVIRPVDLESLGNGIEVADEGLTEEAAEAAEASALEDLQTTAVLPTAGGYICYIRKQTSGVQRIYVHDQTTDTSTLLYNGINPIQSVACDETGKIITFIATTPAGGSDPEVWRYNSNTSTLTQLTADGLDQYSITMNGVGNRIAWEQRPSAGGIRTISLRDYTTATSYTEILIAAGVHSRMPHINTPGTYMVYQTYTSSGNASVKLYNLATNTQSTIAISTAIITSPTVNNDGKKIAYRLTYPSSSPLANSVRVKLRNLSTGTTTTIFNVTKSGWNLVRPVLGGDGDYIAYARITSGTFDVWTRKLSTGTPARLTYSNSTNGYQYLNPYWQWKLSGNCIFGSGQFGSCTFGP